MWKYLFRIFLAVSIIATVFTGACGGDDTSAIETGIIVMGVTDKPDEDITGILVTTNLIEGSVQAAEGDNQSEWQVMLDEEKSFDLIQVAGVEDILGEADIPAGTYNQIRMHVTSVVVTLNGEDVEATVPSGVIRLVRPIDIKAGEKTVVTFDFDAQESVVVTGADKIIFKPVVKLLVRKGDEPFKPASGTQTANKGEQSKPVDTSPAELPPMKQGDENGFFLNITSPEQSEVIVDTDTVLIEGKTSVDAAVSVGEEFIDINLDGTFEKVVALEEGINIIEVIASISAGQQYSQVITVVYTP